MLSKHSEKVFPSHTWKNQEQLKKTNGELQWENDEKENFKNEKYMGLKKLTL